MVSFNIMKTNPLLYLCCIALLALQTLIARAAPPTSPPQMNTSTAGEFSAVGNALAELLKTHDVQRFVAEMAPTDKDIRAVVPTNMFENENDPEAFSQFTGHASQAAQSTAEALLARADSLHLNFADSNLVASVIPPEAMARIFFASNPGPDNQGAPFVRRLQFILSPNANAAPSTNGDFKIAVNELIKFPSGWKINGGAEWADFPSSVAGEKVRHEMAILQKISDQHGLTGQDDPALLQLADAVVHFIRAGDFQVYQEDALANGNDVYALIQKITKSQGQPAPAPADFFQNWNPQQQDWLNAAGTVLELMTNSGIDLKDAQIQVTSASVEKLQAPIGSGLDGMAGVQFQMQFSVQSTGKSKTGTSLAGDYSLSADQIMRLADNWRISGNLQWDKMPDGVLAAKDEAQLELQSYLATHTTLPPGIEAPDIEFTRLDNGQKMKLSDLRGKVVVLDFWATWCGPCQEPMAHLQTLRDQNPDWKDRVAIVPLSIDDAIGIIRNHVETRGWTNTFNVWAGEGGFDSAPAQAFHVKGIPATYIIDAQGKIVTAGHPAGMDIDGEVNALLNPGK